MGLLTACSSNTSTNISGTYVGSYHNEYTVGKDTLLISQSNSNAATYEIERHSGYQKIRNGKTLPTEYKQVKWTATFNKDKQALEETAYGRQLQFSKDWQSVSLGDNHYQKLK